LGGGGLQPGLLNTAIVFETGVWKYATIGGRLGFPRLGIAGVVFSKGWKKMTGCSYQEGAVHEES
jgi:hypothetical protein